MIHIVSERTGSRDTGRNERYKNNRSVHQNIHGRGTNNNSFDEVKRGEFFSLPTTQRNNDFTAIHVASDEALDIGSSGPQLRP